MIRRINKTVVAWSALERANHLPGSEHGLGRAMQRLGPRAGDPDKLTELDTRLEVAGDNIGLHHQAHVLLHRERGHLSCRTTFGADDRRQIAAAKAMHEIIVSGETVLLDNPRSLDKVLR